MEDQTTLAARLEESHREVKASASQFTDKAAAARPGAEKWSALDILEHIALTDAHFRSMIKAGTITNTDQVKPERETHLLPLVLDRSNPRPAPEHVQPTGKFSSVSEALQALDANHRANLDFVNDNRDQLRYIEVQHARFGVLSGYEFVLIMAEHAKRHVAQLNELPR